jgi:CRISPR-associated protein Csx17
MAAFPFTVNVSQAGAAALTGRDERKPKNAKRDIAELWLPLWDRHLGLQELSLLLSEGRVSLGTRAAETGVDFARAASSFGLDRGITEFQRTAFLMRNGQNFMSIPLGRFSVSDTRDSDLLNEIDGWLLRFRRACNEKAPARLAQALLRLEQAIFDFCRYGGPTRFAEILCALGEAEKRLAIAEGWRTEKRIRPLGGLSPQWITAANDNSLEFELALALAGIHDPQFKVGPLRTNLEPVSTDGYKGRYAQIKWAENGRSVVWNSADLCVNLAAVLDRRLMDGKREGCANLPLAFQHAVSLESIAAFLYGAVNRKKLAELLWGIILIDRNGSYPHFPSARVNGTVVLPRAYALLKLLFLPRPIMIPSNPEGTRETRFTRIGESGIRILPEACVLSLLRAGRVNEACAIASRRLHSSGLAPILVEWEDLGSINGLGLASALLIPITEAHIGTLLGIVTRPTQHPICSPEVERR